MRGRDGSLTGTGRGWASVPLTLLGVWILSSHALVLGCSSGPNFISTPPDVAPAPPPANPAPPVADGDERLTRKVEPLAYRLEFEIDPTLPHYRGATEIHVRVHEATSTLRLHAQGLDFEEAFAVRANAPDGPRVPARVYPGKNGGLALAFSEPLDGEWLLEFSYSAPLDEVPMSLYRARDGDEWYAFTQFEALAAREAFPCFDEPQFKTPFTTSIITPASMKAASNAPLSKATPVGSGVRYDFAITEPLPTYLVAMAVGNFDVAEYPAAPAGQPPQRILTVRGKSQHTAFALRESSKILAQLSEYFGSPYPYEKLDQVAVPSFRAGAMENAGLVTYREQFLIIDEARGSVTDKLAAQSIIAHELAHMWFGNLVTMQWWDDLWLNEAFATWMSNVVLKKIAPETEPELQAVKSMVEVMDQDALTSATPVRKRIANSGDIDNAFDRITYLKGLSVLRMLEHWVGAERFRTGIRKYLERHAWKNATMFDLFDALDEASERPVSPIAQRFVEKPGVPLVDLDWSCKDGRVELAFDQRRYLLSSATAGSDPWQLPICVRAAGAGQTASHCFLFDSGGSTVETPDWKFCPAFVHPNAGETSYYRWKLEPKRFLALTREFRSELSPAERVALPSHAFALLEAGALDGPTYLSALEGLGKDEHWLVLEGVLDGLGKLNRILTEPAQREALASFTRRLLAPHAKRIGFAPRPEEPVSAGLVRSRLFHALGSIGSDTETLKTARQVAEQVLQDPEQVAPALAAQSLALAALAGDAKLHDGLVALLGTRSPALRDAIVRALAAFRDPVLLRRTYDLLLQGTLRAQDYNVLPRTAARDAATQSVFWTWYAEHEQELMQLLGARVSAALPWVVAGFCSQAELETARAHFAHPEKLGPGARQNLDQALETASRCLNLRQTVEPTLKHRLGEVAQTR